MNNYTPKSDFLAWLPHRRLSVLPSDHPTRLPVPELRIDDNTGSGSYFYTITTICCHGQVGDRAPVKLLNWASSDRVSLTVDNQVIVAVVDPIGDSQIGPRGHLRIPATVRHRCGIKPGERVLVAASAEHRAVLVYPLALVHHALSMHHTRMGGGV